MDKKAAQKYLSILGEPDDLFCPGHTIGDTSLQPLSKIAQLEVLPQLITRNALKNRRLKENVISLRTHGFESDAASLEFQLELLENSKFPFSAITFSGNDSYHAQVSLTTPCADFADFEALTARIYAAFEKLAAEAGWKPCEYNGKFHKRYVDTTNKDPARFTRLAGAVRDNGVLQEAVLLGERQDRSEVESWLIQQGFGPETFQPKTFLKTIIPKGMKGLPSKNVVQFLRHGDYSWAQGRNNAVFITSAELTRCNYSLEEIFSVLDPVRKKLIAHDFSDSEFITALRSGHRASPK